MKYYIYISDTKLDMLYPQVPHEIKKKVATEFGIDFKLLKATRKAEVESEENRITKLEAVLAFIREYGNLGSVEEPNDYFEDTLPMRFQIIDEMMYLSGRTEQTILGLGGSAQHLLGGVSVKSNFSPYSAQLGYMIVRNLKAIEKEEARVTFLPTAGFFIILEGV